MQSKTNKAHTSTARIKGLEAPRCDCAAANWLSNSWIDNTKAGMNEVYVSA